MKSNGIITINLINMDTAFLIIGLTIIYILIQLGHNQKVICKNQIQQAKLLQELIDKKSKK